MSLVSWQATSNSARSLSCVFGAGMSNQSNFKSCNQSSNTTAKQAPFLYNSFLKRRRLSNAMQQKSACNLPNYIIKEQERN